MEDDVVENDYTIIKKPEDDEREDPYTSLGYTKGGWKKPTKSDKKPIKNKDVRKPVRESAVNEEQFFMYLLDRIETEHPELIRRHGNEQVLDAVVDVAGDVIDSGNFQARDLNTYVTRIVKNLENIF